MPFLPPNQQRQSTEGHKSNKSNLKQISDSRTLSYKKMAERRAESVILIKRQTPITDIFETRPALGAGGY